MTRLRVSSSVLFFVCVALVGCDDRSSNDAKDAAADKDKKPKTKKSKRDKNKGDIKGSATAKSPPPPELPPPVIMGAAGTAGDLIVTVRDVNEVQPSAKSERPKPDQKLLAVSVLAATEKGSAMVAGALFDIVSTDGKRFRSSILPCTDKPLKAGNVTKEAPMEADLCFVVPKQGTLRMVLKDGGKDAVAFKLGFK